MNKLIVTRWNQQILTALIADGKCRQLRLEDEGQKSLLGNIYVGKVKNVVKNIGAAFIDLGGGRMGFYSLTENQDHLFVSAPFSDTSKKKQVKAGDELIVQVSKDAVKTKDPVLSCYLNFTGKYSVLTYAKTQIGFSAKIKDALWKDNMRDYLMPLKEDYFGIIVRTNAREVSKEEIGEEVLALKKKMQTLLSKADCRTCYSVLAETMPAYVQYMRDLYAKDLEAIVTDDRSCFEEMDAYLREFQPEDTKKLSFYGDEAFPLLKVYSLETVMKEATGRHVWLKSGGYLVIEPTEALTVIDVNTGKYSGKKNPEDTILKINLEAAVEAVRQLQLRNISGIIIIDFIDMTLPEHKDFLLRTLESELLKDPVKAVLVDMTKLGLVEITRKKTHKSLSEQMT